MAEKHIVKPRVRLVGMLVGLLASSQELCCLQQQATWLHIVRMASILASACAGLWFAEESVGDAGPTSLGYFGCAWSPRADYIVSHGFTGALHLWQQTGQILMLNLLATPRVHACAPCCTLAASAHQAECLTVLPCAHGVAGQEEAVFYERLASLASCLIGACVPSAMTWYAAVSVEGLAACRSGASWLFLMRRDEQRNLPTACLIGLTCLTVDIA